MNIDDIKIAIVIPARLDSTRLKEKMLIEFDGEPLIRLVYDKCRTMGYDTYVITDSKKIAKHITIGNVIMTGKAENGTERIASVVDSKQLESYDVLINIQGDMLSINVDTLRPILRECKDFSSWDVLTCYTKGAKSDDVKVIHNYGKALWFTRSNIGYGDRHLGIYAYKRHILRSYDLFTDEYPIECLEQNRILGMYDVNVVQVKYDGKEINTKQDLF